MRTYRVGQSNAPRFAVNVTAILVHLIVHDSSQGKKHNANLNSAIAALGHKHFAIEAGGDRQRSQGAALQEHSLE